MKKYEKKFGSLSNGYIFASLLKAKKHSSLAQLVRAHDC